MTNKQRQGERLEEILFALEIGQKHFCDKTGVQQSHMSLALKSEAKTWKKRVVTIPKSILHYFTDGIFDKHPTNYYLFGRKQIGPRSWSLEPATTQISECRMYKRHRRVLERLRDAGKLGDITGLHWYSWKDTGISMHTRKTSPVATKDQAGHADLSITSVYYHAEPVNVEYRGLENDLF